MTLRIEYQGIVLVKVKVPDAVSDSKDDPTARKIATAVLSSIDQRVLDWDAPIYISIERSDSGEGCQLNVWDFLDIRTGKAHE